VDRESLIAKASFGRASRRHTVKGGTMHKRVVWMAAAALVVLVGCAEEHRRGPGGGSTDSRLSCHGASCTIVVNLDCSVTPCRAQADPKSLEVELPHGAKVIHWMLRGQPGYAFADEQVQFAGGAPFRCPPPGAGRTEVTCVDNHQGPGMYGYTLAVVKTGDSSSRIPVDPWIINR